MKHIIFPKKCSQRYYGIHFKYVLELFRYCNYNITLDNFDNDFKTIINGKEFYFDYADYPELEIPKDVQGFKFHCHKEIDSIYSFSPVSFYNWNEYYELEKQINYKARGIISNRQKPFDVNMERREKIQNLLRTRYFSETETSTIDKVEYWKEVEKCFISVCVPGCTNNMLDRGQWQYMAFGCCTISPNLPEILPYHKTLVSGEHYLQCKNDYSDLLEIIEWCRLNKTKCIEIGQEAKKLFKTVGTPEKLIEWIESK